MVLARGIAAGMTFAVLAVVGPATGESAERKTFTGAFERGGQVSFQLRRGNTAKVNQIRIEEIVAACRGGTAVLNFAIYGSTPVLSDRSFKVRSEDGSGGMALVKGRFSRSFKRVRGLARVYGKFDFGPDGSAECDSGKQRYVAR